MDNNDVKVLVDAFRGYRDLISPIQSGLNDFIVTYEAMRNDIEKLNTAFSDDLKGNLEKIYKNLSKQAEKATDLASYIDTFSKTTDKYSQGINKLLELFEKTSSKLTSINELDARAEEQLDKLDAIIEEKRKTYNVKELERSLDNYNENVKKMNEFINREVADSLTQNSKIIDSIKSGSDSLNKNITENNGSIEKLLEEYSSTNELLRKITEKEDVNEAYIYDILDRWATSRKVKIKK